MFRESARYIASPELSPDPASNEATYEYKILTDPEQRKLLLAKTEELAQEVRSRNIKHMVFLDKSARPLAPLFRQVFNKHRGKEERLPTINFINVGTEKVVDIQKRYKEEFDQDHIFSNILKRHSVEELFGAAEVEEIRERYSYLRLAEPGSEVVVVDEISDSGQSFEVAQKLISGCFPDLKLRFFAFSKGVGDELFSREGEGNYIPNAPWRRQWGEDGVNATGVADDTPEAFLSKRLNPQEHPAEIDVNKQLRAEIAELAKENKQPAALPPKQVAPVKSKAGWSFGGGGGSGYSYGDFSSDNRGAAHKGSSGKKGIISGLWDRIKEWNKQYFR